MYNCWGKRTVMGLCEPLWSIRLNYQLVTKLEMKHILQEQVCDGISTKKMGNYWYIIKSAKSSTLARWNRTVLKFDSENQLNVHNCLQG